MKIKMTRRSVSAEDVAMRNLVDIALPSSSVPSQITDSRLRNYYDSSSDSSLSIYTFGNDDDAGLQNTFVRAAAAEQRRFTDRLHSVLQLKQQLRRLNCILTTVFIVLGLMCLVTAGLTLVIPRQADSAIAQQMVNTLFTMLNITGVLCIVQGVAWSGTNPSRSSMLNRVLFWPLPVPNRREEMRQARLHQHANQEANAVL